MTPARAPSVPDSRNHADEDADEQLGDFKDRFPREVVQLAAFLRGQSQGGAGEGEQDNVAGGVLKLNVRAVDFEAGFGLPNAGHEYRDDDADQKQEVDLAVEAELFIGLGGRFGLAFLAEQERIQKEEDAEQDDGKQHGFAEQMHGRPEEGHALEEAEEQRRVAEGGQGAADVGDKENEEDDDVHTVLAVLIGPEQGPDEQHGRAGGSHPAGEDGPEGEQPGVHHRRAHELTFEADATRDCEQCEQQDDERDVFHEEDMDELIDSQLESEDHGAGHEEGEAPEEGHLAEMVMPEMRHGKGADGDGQQHANKGNNPQDGQFRSVEVVTAGSLGRQGYQRRQRQRHKHGKQSFHLGSAPWENFFYQTFL